MTKEEAKLILSERDYWRGLAKAAIDVLQNFTIMNSYLTEDDKTKNLELWNKYLKLKNRLS